MRTARTLQAKIGEFLPNSIKRLAKKYRCAWYQRVADQQFRKKQLPDVSTSGGPQHIVLIIVDSLRADFLNSNSTRFIESLPGGDAVAPAPWTYPSVCSILSGKYPHNHGSIRQSDEKDNSNKDDFVLPPKLDDQVTALPELFSGAGYESYGAFAAEMPMLAVGGRFQKHALYNNASAEKVLGDYIDWVKQRTDQYTFAYLHLFDPHQPTDPPREYWRSHDVDATIDNIKDWRFTENQDEEGAKYFIKHKKRLYRATIDYVDDQLSKFSDRINSLLEGPTMIITADHGEAFWEFSEFDKQRFYDSRPAYCVGHGGTPYESIARVPLRGKNIPIDNGPNSLVDIAPTLLKITSLECDVSMDGRSHASKRPDDRTLLIEGARYGYEKKAAYKNNQKLVVSKGDEAKIGFELPSETPIDLPTSVETELTTALPSWPQGSEMREVSESVQRRLEDLGYN